MSDIQKIYLRACEVSPPPGDTADRKPPELPLCNGQFVGWESTVMPPTAPNQPGPVSNSLREAAEEYFELVATPQAAAQLSHFTGMGDAHGVDRGTAPVNP